MSRMAWIAVTMVGVFLCSRAGAQTLNLLDLEPGGTLDSSRSPAPPPGPAVPGWMRPEPSRNFIDQLLFPRVFPELARCNVAAPLIPGLDGPCIPQGVAWMSDRTLAISYYLPEGALKEPPGSVVTVIDGTTGAVLSVHGLEDVDGKPWRGHAGGLGASPTHLWSGSGGRLLRFPRPASISGPLRAQVAFEVDAAASFVALDGNTLWTGDFYRSGDGDPRRRWAVAYTIDAATGHLRSTATRLAPDGRTVLAPDRAVRIPDRVQGLAMVGPYMALSRSYGPHTSTLELYARPVDVAPGVVTDLPSQALRILKLPAGSEDLEAAGHRLAVVFEGGAREYRSRWRAAGALIEDRCLVLDLE